MNDAVLILNPLAGSLQGNEPERAAAEVTQAFAAVGISFSAVKIDTAGKLKTLCAEALHERPGAVIVGGGDGSISTAARCLAGSDIPLGVLPLGTLNHFARDLGLPVEWREAIPVLADQRVASVDLGEVNGRGFLNNCSLGAYPDAVRRRDVLRREHGTRKSWAMFRASMAVFWRLRSRRFRIAMGDTRRTVRTPFLLVANNRYSGHVLDGSLRQRLDEHQLWIYTTQVRGRWPLLRLAWQSLVRRIDLADDLESWPAEELTVDVESQRVRVPVGIDGEVTDLVPPLRFRTRPGALRVFVGPKPTSQ